MNRFTFRTPPAPNKVETAARPPRGGIYTAMEKRLLNEFQRDFPLTPRPYAELARALGTDAGTVKAALRRLQANGAISRIGPVFRPNAVDVSLLAAMAVPENQLEDVAAVVNSYPEVNHNYEREHRFNLWFVLHADDSDRLHAVLDEIEARTAIPVLRLPILDDYHIDLGFDLAWHN